MCSLTVDVLLGGAFACCLFCFLITESGPGLYDRNANANTNRCGPNPHKNQGFDLFRWHFFCFVLTSSLLSLKRIYILHDSSKLLQTHLKTQVHGWWTWWGFHPIITSRAFHFLALFLFYFSFLSSLQFELVSSLDLLFKMIIICLFIHMCIFLF